MVKLPFVDCVARRFSAGFAVYSNHLDYQPACWLAARQAQKEISSWKTASGTDWHPGVLNHYGHLFHADPQRVGRETTP